MASYLNFNVNFSPDLHAEANDLLDSLASHALSFPPFSDDDGLQEVDGGDHEQDYDRDNSFEPQEGEELFHYDPLEVEEDPEIIRGHSASTNENSSESVSQSSTHSSSPRNRDSEESQLVSEENKQVEENHEESESVSIAEDPESEHLMRPDNVRKATIRAGNRVVKTFIDDSFAKYK